MKFTTRTGDNGITDIYGQRVDKCCDIIELLGSLDESASVISVASCFITDEAVKDELMSVIHSVTKICASVNKKEDACMDDEIKFIESRISYYEQISGEIRLFEYPRKKEAAVLDYARCVVRKAERCAVRCKRDIRYLNRLSDYLFLLSRYMENGENL